MPAFLSAVVDTLGLEALRTLALAWAPRVVASLLTVLVFWILLRSSKNVLTRVFSRVGLDQTAAGFLQAITRLVLVVVGTLTALGQLGIDTTGVLASLGVLGLTVGFAAQNTLSNIISGLFIFWDRPFVLGDLVEVDGEYGRVEEITLRSTRLVTVDGRMLAFPNAQIANAKVASYTNFPHLRIDIDVTVGVNEPIGRIREVLLGLIEGDDAWMAEPAPVVVVKSLGDFNVTVELRAWLDNERDHMPARFALRERVKDALDAAGVEMPFETLQIQPIEVRSSAAAK